MTSRVLVGDCLTTLPTLAAGSVQCCVTSPPYFGLRDYGAAGQIGLEPTPDEYVARLAAVFREVRRVLTDDGTLWLNLGDSYANDTKWGGSTGGKHVSALHAAGSMGRERRTTGLKPKDLIGIPWRVAFALQQPYYAGTIRDERDRIWLAAMLDAEGCLFIQKRKAGQPNGQGYLRQNDNYGPGVEISNTSRAVVERIATLVGKGSICSQGPEQNGRRKQTIYRWSLRTTECREFVRELYPYLVAKQQQARILSGCPSSGERAEAAHGALIALHRTGSSTVDFPAPPSLYEPGYYLRSDIVWSKCNPMPESVTDRPTKAHEYVFLLSKSARYFYDADAIREPLVKGNAGSEFHTGKTGEHQLGRASTKPRRSGNVERSYGAERGRPDSHLAGNVPWEDDGTGRNARSVWTIATQPYSGAHFATMPPALADRCIKAGSRRGDTVLDPFGGTGTTGLVADRLGRDAVLCELNPEYAALAEERIRSDAPLFADGAA